MYDDPWVCRRLLDLVMEIFTPTLLDISKRTDSLYSGGEAVETESERSRELFSAGAFFSSAKSLGRACDR